MSLQQRLQNTPKKQSGVALITMLMIFAIVTIMTADTTERMGLDIRKTSFYLQNAQANEYALSAEALARQLLFDDFELDKEGTNNDHLLEPWALLELPFQPSNGKIQIVINDLQGRYNINNLIAEDGKTNPEALASFTKMLISLDLPSTLANNISDWLDSNTVPTGYYSEDTSYMNKTPGYRAANQPITDISELLAIAEIDIEKYNVLAPFITALPTPTLININTAEKAVLATINDKLDAQKIIDARDQLPEGFGSAQEFLESDVTAGQEINTEIISVETEYFEVWIKADFQEQTTYLRSRFFRDNTDGQLVLLGRTFSRPMDSVNNNPFSPKLAQNDEDIDIDDNENIDDSDKSDTDEREELPTTNL